MDIEVSEFAILATTKCKKDFSCLGGKQECMCEVAGANGHKTVAIKAKSVLSCKYLLHLNASSYCLCPVRNAIYNNYKV